MDSSPMTNSPCVEAAASCLLIRSFMSCSFTWFAIVSCDPPFPEQRTYMTALSTDILIVVERRSQANRGKRLLFRPSPRVGGTDSRGRRRGTVRTADALDRFGIRGQEIRSLYTGQQHLGNTLCRRERSAPVLRPGAAHFSPDYRPCNSHSGIPDGLGTSPRS